MCPIPDLERHLATARPGGEETREIRVPNRLQCTSDLGDTYFSLESLPFRSDASHELGKARVGVQILQKGVAMCQEGVVNVPTLRGTFQPFQRFVSAIQ